jgi:hypothetical protein
MQVAHAGAVDWVIGDPSENIYRTCHRIAAKLYHRNMRCTHPGAPYIPAPWGDSDTEVRTEESIVTTLQ